MKGPKIERFKVDEKDHGSSLLSFLKQKFPSGTSVRFLKKTIESKECSVNGRVQYFSTYQLVKGDIVEVKSLLAHVEKIACSIVYEDQYLIIINKPPFVVSDAEKIAELIHYKKEPLFLIHRLDKDTSGLLMLAKTESMFQMMKELFAKKQIHKVYIALVDGAILKKQGIIDNYLGKKGSYQGQTIYGSMDHGERAITHWKVLSKGIRSSFVLLEPKTGRTHQLRVHLKELGNPILGDYQYATKYQCPIMPVRHMLHAWGLKFVHPITGQSVEIIAALAEDFVSLANQLKIQLSSLPNRLL